MRADDYESVGRVIRAGWGGREDFLPNPSIDEGFMRSLYAQVRFGSDLDHLWLSWERSNDDFLSSDFEFSQLTLQGRTRLRMGRHQYIDLRGRFGTNLSGTLPRQKRYLLGGIGTVRGYRYQSLLMAAEEGSSLPYGGERLALFNAEYALGVDDDIHLALFFDSGMAYVDREADVELEDWSSSVGLGVFTGDEDEEVDLRLDLIKPLDDGGSDFMVQGRLKRMF
jgi:hemolysin activation/secretion protein